MLLRGAPGVGKTTLLLEAVEGIEAGGKQVFAFAPSAEASRGTLREAGFAEADTVARLLKDQRLQERVRGQVLLVDEASLLGARDASEFFALCDRLSCRAIVVGDKNQHSAVERPGTLRLLEQEAGLPVAEVADIQRQRGKYKEIVELLSRGDTDRALQRLVALGWVREITEGPEREQQLAEDYLAVVGRRKRNGQHQTALVVSPSHAEGERIAAVIREELKRRGRITGEERELTRLDKLDLTAAERNDARRYVEGEVIQFYQPVPGFRRGQRVVVAGRDELGHVCVETEQGHIKALRLDQADKFQVFRPDTLKLAAGDRLRITSNGTTQDGAHRLNNGALYTVTGFTHAGDVVLANGWVVPASYQHWAQGYVITSQASQSKTVDQVIAGMSARSFAAMSRQGLLVTVSRGRDKATLYTDDLEGLKEAVRRSEDRLTATELLKERQAKRRAAEDEHVRHLQRWVRAAGEKAGAALVRLFGTPGGLDLADRVRTRAALGEAVAETLKRAADAGRSPHQRTR
jgi:ATP-dependent exoDNAse (exonuclease V) alpha subunit